MVFCLSGFTKFCSGLPYVFCLDFTSLSVMSGQCLGVAGSLNAHLECCLSEISHPRHIKIFHPVTLYQHRLDQYQLYFLDAEGQEKKQLVPFLFVLTFTTLRVKAADDNFTTFKKFVFLTFPGKQN